MHRSLYAHMCSYVLARGGRPAPGLWRRALVFALNVQLVRDGARPAYLLPEPGGARRPPSVPGLRAFRGRLGVLYTAGGCECPNGHSAARPAATPAPAPALAPAPCDLCAVRANLDAPRKSAVEAEGRLLGYVTPLRGGEPAPGTTLEWRANIDGRVSVCFLREFLSKGGGASAKAQRKKRTLRDAGARLGVAISC